MMVSCPGCNTSYSIDERKVPTGGGRLTCRECGKKWKVGVPPVDRTPTAPPPAEAALQVSDSSASLQKPVNCPKCGHHFVPYAAQGRGPKLQPPAGKTSPPKGRVLLVEDQHYFAELTREALGDSYETTVASTLASARRLVETKQFDLVILDLSLEEGQDGTKVLQATRQRAVPVLIFTARDETELYGGAWDQLRAAGATDILFKGINVGDELRQKVKSLLGTPQK
ncbi:MAG TPA: zinc-ribbon domain-containing protein [Candidatus Polarisedimenticolia bacterium]|jgi:predicted Zn finger-like uncharacterized protein